MHDEHDALRERMTHWGGQRVEMKGRGPMPTEPRFTFVGEDTELVQGGPTWHTIPVAVHAALIGGLPGLMRE